MSQEDPLQDPMNPQDKAASGRDEKISWLQRWLVRGAVVVGILLVLGIGVWAVMEIRQHNTRQQSANNLRQIGLATQNCNDSFGQVPLVSGPWPGLPQNDMSHRSLFQLLLPYFESTNLSFLANAPNPPRTFIKVYVSPEDFTGNGKQGQCSYAANWQFFQHPLAKEGEKQAYSCFPRSYPDGSTNTVLFAEIYQDCNGTIRYWGQTGDAYNLSTAAFNRMKDVNPTKLNEELQLFQLGPTRESCSPALAQSPNRKEMWIGLADGSVRNMGAYNSLMVWRLVCCPADGTVGFGDW